MWGSGGMKKKTCQSKIYVTMIAIAFLQSFSSQATRFIKEQEVVKHVRSKKILRRQPGILQTITPQKIKQFLHDGITDSVKIWDNFFTLNTMGVLSATLPFYLIGRRADPVLHRQFYDAENHRNKNQPPAWVESVFYKEAVVVPFIGYVMTCLAGESDDSWREAQLFVTGITWAWATKTFVKGLKTESGLRPWHEEFDKHERSHGGNPSGHATTSSFMATYVGFVHGPRWGIPFSLYAAAVGSFSVVSNHHYISQVFAGAGLGFALGLATYLVFEDSTLPKNIQAGLTADQKGNLGIRIAYDF